MNKAHFFSLATLVTIVLFSCSKPDNDPGNDPAPNPQGTVDSATVTVVNGYGSGKYKVGDTVHIWSNPSADNAVFDQWTGYGSLINNTGEWHNFFVMPAQNVSVTANQKAITAFTLKYEKIKAVDNQKNIYYWT